MFGVKAWRGRGMGWWLWSMVVERLKVCDGEMCQVGQKRPTSGAREAHWDCGFAHSQPTTPPPPPNTVGTGVKCKARR